MLTVLILFSIFSFMAAFERLIFTFGLLEKGVFIRRYKRFLADVDFKTFEETVHCPNTGSMLGLMPSESHQRLCACSRAPAGSKRKYARTLEVVWDKSAWVGIHSALANKMVENALRSGYIELGKFSRITSINREVNVASGCRIDFEITLDSNVKCLLEVKSVTLAVEKEMTESTGVTSRVSSEPYGGGLSGLSGLSAEFPDCRSERAQKHIKHLTKHVAAGGSAAVLFLIQRDDCSSFSASPLDPEYKELLSIASQAGVQVLPYHCRIDPVTGDVHLLGKLPFIDSYLNAAAPAPSSRAPGRASKKKTATSSSTCLLKPAATAAAGETQTAEAADEVSNSVEAVPGKSTKKRRINAAKTAKQSKGYNSND